MFGTFGFWEILLIVVVLLLLFGPKKLPDLARAIGEAYREFKKSTSAPIVEEEKTPVKEATATQKSGEEALVELAKKLGISTEGKSMSEIAKEIAEVTEKRQSK